MITQFFGHEIVKKLSKTSSTTVQLLAGSILKLGGVGSNLTNNLFLNTAVVGAGGMESAIVANKFYYVYVVISGVTEFLIASTSEIKPLAFNSYRKVGAFETDNVSNIVKAYIVGDKLKDHEAIAAYISDFWDTTGSVDSFDIGLVTNPNNRIFEIINDSGQTRIKGKIGANYLVTYNMSATAGTGCKVYHSILGQLGIMQDNTSASAFEITRKIKLSVDEYFYIQLDSVNSRLGGISVIATPEESINWNL